MINLQDTDSYKFSHYAMLPPGTQQVFQYGESRGGEYDRTLFFGLQGLLQDHFVGQLTERQIIETSIMALEHGLPFNTQGFMDIVKYYDGYLPLKICAVREGSLVPTHNVLWTVENTDSAFPWLPSYFETTLLRLWYPITVATQSYYLKQLILEYLYNTADDPQSEILFKLHDFGARGVSSLESASIGGAAHLVNFRGTDTVPALGYLRDHYHERMAGYSIPAAEHSIIMAWGEAHEVDAYRNILKQFTPNHKLIAVVSDTYNLWEAIDKLWGGELRQEVIDSGATIVIRPDSGRPAEVVLRALQHLDAKFGSYSNSKGYRVLNHVRVIQGDGVDRDAIDSVLYVATREGYSATNIAFGMGGGLLQQVNRDTQKFAQKTSWVVVEGEERAVSKHPIDDPSKQSLAGRLELVKLDGQYQTLRLEDAIGLESELVPYFENGRLLVDDDLATIRARSEQNGTD